MLENLNTAKKIQNTPFGTPKVEIEGSKGSAITPGMKDGQDFREYLLDAGMDPDRVEIVGVPRTSRWQVYDGSWRTSYRFHFRMLDSPRVDLPTLYREAKKKAPKPTQKTLTDTALVILWSDLQIGKVDSRGGTEELIQRVTATRHRLIDLVKKQKPSHIVFADVGDLIEGFSNTQDMQQAVTNDLSIQDQIDLAITLIWETLRELSKHCNNISYLTVGSNHCQWRINKQKVGTSLDDWGVHVGRTLARLCKEVGLPIQFYEPETHNESLVHDVFGDNFHRIGLFHGHQARRPDNVPNWIQGQMLGNGPVSASTIFISGHFHHLQVRELGNTERGTSRYWVQAKTLDAGSSWYRLNAGHDSDTGLVCIPLEKGKEFTGTVQVL